jgi:hypothetical protein
MNTGLSSTSRQDRVPDPPPWPHPPWLTTCPQLSGGATHQNERKVRPPPLSETRVGSPSKVRVREKGVLEEDEAVFNFFSQLWVIDSPPPLRNPTILATSSRFDPPSHLFGIRKELLESKEFTSQDCFPARRSDQFGQKPVHINFAKDMWGSRTGKRSYAEALKSPMAE